MGPWMSCADPGRVHTEGRLARAALEEAREQVAAFLGTRARQVIFTSGGTEAINAAVYGVMRSGRGDGVAFAEVEHSAVREASRRDARTVVSLPVDRTARIDVEAVEKALSADGLALLHCQWANHEVGTLQPVAEVVAAGRRQAVLVHVDAAAAAGQVRVSFDELGADLMSVSAHKFGGPRGVGALLIRRGLRIHPFIVGGSQERARRAGLEDVAAAVGFGAAATELSTPGRIELESENALRRSDQLRAAAAAVAGVEIYGPVVPDQRLPHLVCLGIAGVEAEGVLVGLDRAGVAAHSGSACSSEELEPSPVLAAMGVDAEQSLRLSVGWSTTDEDVARAEQALPEVIARLRALGAAPGA
jgi:cysteine desulfurase